MSRLEMAMDTRRKPNPTARRRDLCDAAIALLAEDGSKGLSHLKVDRRSGVPDGTTSFYFRTRSALLRAVAQRLGELDLQSLQSVADAAAGLGGPEGGWDGRSPSVLSQVVIRAGSEPELSRIRVRYELTMQAARDPELAEILQQGTEAFNAVHREILVQLMPHGAELDSAVVEDLSNVTLTFINGLLLRFAFGDRIIDSPEELDRILAAIAAGIMHAPEQGHLTRTEGSRVAGRRTGAASRSAAENSKVPAVGGFS